jgi:hypothetical protein
MRALFIQVLGRVGEMEANHRENMIPMSSLITARRIKESLQCIKEINRAINSNLAGMEEVDTLPWSKPTINMATPEMSSFRILGERNKVEKSKSQRVVKSRGWMVKNDL